jgi:diazepam-binding inhibitor (GABA receptor modulating acyl-CoA-binding protein)
LISYGLFKQITSGDNTNARPWAIQYEAAAKHDSWLSFKGKSNEECMKLYVEEWEKQKAEFNK